MSARFDLIYNPTLKGSYPTSGFMVIWHTICILEIKLEICDAPTTLNIELKEWPPNHELPDKDLKLKQFIDTYSETRHLFWIG